MFVKYKNDSFRFLFLTTCHKGREFVIQFRRTLGSLFFENLLIYSSHWTRSVHGYNTIPTRKRFGLFDVKAQSQYTRTWELTWAHKWHLNRRIKHVRYMWYNTLLWRRKSINPVKYMVLHCCCNNTWHLHTHIRWQRMTNQDYLYNS